MVPRAIVTLRGDSQASAAVPATFSQFAQPVAGRLLVLRPDHGATAFHKAFGVLAVQHRRKGQAAGVHVLYAFDI